MAVEQTVKVVKVAELFVIEEGDKIVDLEVGFTEAITAPQGAVVTLDLMRNALNNSGWVTKAVMGVQDKSGGTPLPVEPDAPQESTSQNGDAKED